MSSLPKLVAPKLRDLAVLILWIACVYYQDQMMYAFLLSVDALVSFWFGVGLSL